MKKYLITWSSDGLWKNLAEQLVADGHEVIWCSRSPSSTCTYDYIIDFSDEGQVIESIAYIQKNHSDVDGVIHCVGKMYFDEVDEISFSKMQECMQSNVIWITTFTSWIIDLLIQNEADIVFVSSTVWLKSYTKQWLYTASKRAERWIAKYFQTELKDTWCRVVSFCPWGMQTKFHEKITGATIDESKYMPVEWVAQCLKQILYLPKYMEVSEIVINRKVKNIG